VILMQPLTQRARRCEGHDGKMVGWCLHILNRPKNPRVPNAEPEPLPEAGAQRTLEAGRCKAWFGGLPLAHLRA
jgi:hypothetical protein